MVEARWDGRIREATDALGKLCLSAYQCGVPAAIVEPNRKLIQKLLNELGDALRGAHSLTLREYQGSAARTIRTEQDFNRLLTNMAMGIAGESGEVVDLVKKHLFQGHPLDEGKLVDELGDVLWYLSGMAGVLGFGLDLVGARNIEKLTDRYPDGFDPERSINRDKRLEDAGFEV